MVYYHQRMRVQGQQFDGMKNSFQINALEAWA